jgi:hypothetical protein
LLGAVVVARLLVVRIVCVGCGLAAAVLSGCRGWFVAGLRHGAPSIKGSVVGDARMYRPIVGAFARCAAAASVAGSAAVGVSEGEVSGAEGEFPDL